MTGARDTTAESGGGSRRVVAALTGLAARAVALVALVVLAVAGMQLAPVVIMDSDDGLASADVSENTRIDREDTSNYTPHTMDNRNLHFYNSGSNMLIYDSQDDAVNKFTLSDPYNISTGSFVENKTGLAPGSRSMALSDDGTKLYIGDIDDGSTDGKIIEYTLSSPYDIQSANKTDELVLDESNDSPAGLNFVEGGDKMILTDANAGSIFIYSLSEPYNISSSTGKTEFNTGSEVEAAQEVRFNGDGSKMYIPDYYGGIAEYNLSTAYDPLSSTHWQNFSDSDWSSGGQSPQDLVFHNDGSNMIVLTRQDLYHYSTETSGFGEPLSVTVTNTDGNAIEGATVEAINSSTGGTADSGTTDGSGSVELSVDPGEYNVTASKSGYSAGTKSVTVSGPTTVNFSLSSNTHVSDPDPPDGATVSEPPVQLSVLANSTNQSVQSIDVEFYKQDNGTVDPSNDTQIGSRTVAPGERATVTWDPPPGTYRWYAVGTADSGATDTGGPYLLGIGQADIIDGSEQPPDGSNVRPTDNVDLAVDVRVDDNATVEFYDYETGNPENDPLIGSQSVSSGTTTASARWYSDERNSDEEWYVVLKDSTGTRDTAGAFAFGAGGQVVARDAETGEVIDDRTVRFDTTYPGGSEVFDRAPANLNLSKVNAEPGDRIRIDVRAQDYYERTIEVSGKQSDADVFLERGANWSYNPSSDDPDDSASVEDDPDRFISRFKLQDQTGRYPASNTTLTVKADIDGDGRTDLVHSSSFGAANRVDVRVKRDRRYQLSVENDAGDSRGLGGWTATQPDTTTLTISRVTEDIEIDQGYGVDAAVEGGTLKIYYRDYETQAEALNFEVREYPDGPHLENRTLTDVENATITIALNESQAEKTWQVDYEGSRVGVETANISGQVTTGASGRVPLPVGSDVLIAGALVILAIVGALFTGPLSAVGSVGMVGVASVLYFIGWLPINAAALWVATIIAVGSVLRSGGGRLG